MSSSRRLVSLLTCIDLLLCIATVSGQEVGRCSSDVGRSSPFYFKSQDGNRLNICPTAGKQDTIICVPDQDIPTYTTLRRMGATVPVCTLDSDLNMCGNGTYHALLFSTSAVSTTNSIEVISTAEAMFTVIYGMAQDYPLPVEQGLVLEAPGTVTVLSMVFGITPPLPLFPNVCEVLDNGTVIQSTLESRASNVPEDECLPAFEGASLNDAVPSRITLTAQSPIDEPRNITVFLTGDGVCSSTTDRIIENFTLTLVTATGPTTPTTEITTEIPTQPDNAGIIAGAVVAVILLVIVIMVVVILCTVFFRSRQNRGTHIGHDHSDSVPLQGGGTRSNTVSLELPDNYKNGHVPPTLETTFTSKGIEDNDSGVESTGPSTPIKKNLITVVSSEQNDFWDDKFVLSLADKFNATHAPLIVPEAENNNYAIERTVHQLLSRDNFELLCVVWRNSITAPDLSSGQQLHAKLVQMLTSSCQWPHKVCLLRLGSAKSFHIQNPIHDIGIPKLPGDDGFTSEGCAEYVYKEMKSNIIRETNPAATSASSLPPTAFPQVTENAPTHSWPMPPKKPKVQTDLQNGQGLIDAIQPLFDKLEARIQDGQSNLLAGQRDIQDGQRTTHTKITNAQTDLKKGQSVIQNEVNQQGANLTEATKEIKQATEDAKDEIIAEVQKGPISENDSDSDSSRQDS